MFWSIYVRLPWQSWLLWPGVKIPDDREIESAEEIQPKPSWLSYSTVWHFPKKQAQGIRCPNPLFIALSRFQGGEDPPLCLNNPDYSNPLFFVNLRTEKHSPGKIHDRGHLTFGVDKEANSITQAQNIHISTSILFFSISFTLWKHNIACHFKS